MDSEAPPDSAGPDATSLGLVVMARCPLLARKEGTGPGPPKTGDVEKLCSFLFSSVSYTYIFA